MLTDAQKQLVVAAVDGTLSAVGQVRFLRLAADSAEAAELYKRLLADAARLRELPRVAAPAGLADAVLARVRPQAQPKRSAARTRRPAWLPYAVAASLAVVVGGAVTVFLANRPRRPEVAMPRAEPDGGPPGSLLPDRRSVERLPPPRTPVVRPAPEVVRVDPPRSHDVEPLPKELLPTPRPAGEGVLAGTFQDVPKMSAVDVQLPFLAPVIELRTPEVRKKVVAELAKDTAFRLDLFTQDPLRAVEVFRTAASRSGVALTVDAVAQDRLKKKLPAAWAVFTESLTADEIAGLLAKLGEAEEKAAAVNRVFGAAHLVPAKAAELRDVKELFGVELGSTKRQFGGEVPATRPDKPAILVTYLPPGTRANPLLSKEVKAFHERRGERKENAVPLLLVLRPAG